MKDLYIEKFDPWKRLRDSYYTAKEIFPEEEVGIKRDDNYILRSMVYIKAKEFNIDGITKADMFVKMISEAEGVVIKNTDDTIEIDVLFTGT